MSKRTRHPLSATLRMAMLLGIAWLAMKAAERASPKLARRSLRDDDAGSDPARTPAGTRDMATRLSSPAAPSAVAAVMGGPRTSLASGAVALPEG